MSGRTIFTGEFCPGGHYSLGDIIHCDTGAKKSTQPLESSTSDSNVGVEETAAEWTSSERDCAPFSRRSLLLTPLSFRAVWIASPAPVSLYNFERSSKFRPRDYSFFACRDVRLGFPKALMRLAALVKDCFWSIHSFTC